MAWKIAYTAFVLLVVVIWRRHYGWRNFLWFSDIAFIGAVPALWLESAALASVLAVAVLLPEMLWNLDFAGRLLLRRRITGPDGLHVRTRAAQAVAWPVAVPRAAAAGAALDGARIRL